MPDDQPPMDVTPHVIPPGQEYYWTDEWLAAEAETVAELRAGGGRMFDNSADALLFLSRIHRRRAREQLRLGAPL